MTYTLKWLEEFDSGEWLKNRDFTEIDFVESAPSCLANTIEKYVSQFQYTYATNIKASAELVLLVSNASIPHLLGLSKGYHLNLPTSNASSIFEGLKDDWTLERFNKADNGWFKFKLIGVLLLYQILNLKECKFYTVEDILHKKSGNTF